MKEVAVSEGNLMDQLVDRINTWSNEMAGGRLWIEHVRTSCSTLTKL